MPSIRGQADLDAQPSVGAVQTLTSELRQGGDRREWPHKVALPPGSDAREKHYWPVQNFCEDNRLAHVASNLKRDGIGNTLLAFAIVLMRAVQTASVATSLTHRLGHQGLKRTGPSQDDLPVSRKGGSPVFLEVLFCSKRSRRRSRSRMSRAAIHA